MLLDASRARPSLFYKNDRPRLGVASTHPTAVCLCSWRREKDLELKVAATGANDPEKSVRETGTNFCSLLYGSEIKGKRETAKVQSM